MEQKNWLEEMSYQTLMAQVMETNHYTQKTEKGGRGPFGEREGGCA